MDSTGNIVRVSVKVTGVLEEAVFRMDHVLSDATKVVMERNASRSARKTVHLAFVRSVMDRARLVRTDFMETIVR